MDKDDERRDPQIEGDHVIDDMLVGGVRYISITSSADEWKPLVPELTEAQWEALVAYAEKRYGIKVER